MFVAPSILSANFGNLEASIEPVKHAKWLHVDVMDGHFVPNITIGPLVVKGLRSITNQVLDTHLMITDPMTYAPLYIAAGSDRITFHIEAVDDVKKMINLIRDNGAKVGISIKPNTSLDTIKEYIPMIDQVLVMSVEPGFGGQTFMTSALDKIRTLSKWKKHNPDLIIVVDGGINKETAKLCKDAGIDVLVAGSFVFNHKHPAGQMEKLL